MNDLEKSRLWIFAIVAGIASVFFAAFVVVVIAPFEDFANAVFGENTTGIAAYNAREIEPFVGLSDMETIERVSGVFEWTKSYYTPVGETGTFVALEISEMKHQIDRLMITFTRQQTFRIEDSIIQDPHHFSMFLSGYYHAESILYADINEEDLPYMKFAENRKESNWYRVVLYNIATYDWLGGRHSLGSDAELFISMIDDDDMIFYWPSTELTPEPETSYYKRVAPATDGETSLTRAIAGTYLDNARLDSSDLSFPSLRGHERTTYEFDADSSFSIVSQGTVTPRYKGSFNVEEITHEDLPSDLKLQSSLFEEWYEYAPYRITTFNVQGIEEKPVLTLYFLIAENDDVIVYRSDTEDVYKARRLW